ncbi:hypothetical protein jhhlp_004466 [Lomentospora prolificans]|uniref:histidine kinase n=1 Tax=Lomentospora prolificans TaxID=41688 RepID=A0A2N3NBN3_9PEZI|nr:hypothetical protein jhhlp_004466 [Lomentospora prolificans]
MSHEIRTPIAGVLGMAEVLTTTIVDEEKLDVILDFSEVESGRLDIEEVQSSLSGMVEDVYCMLKLGASRKNLCFQYDAPQGLERDFVIGDPGQARQVIMNLLMNSVKFTSEG